jgi:hypothetical protein
MKQSYLKKCVHAKNVYNAWFNLSPHQYSNNGKNTKMCPYFWLEMYIYDTSVSSRPGLRIAGSNAFGLLVVAIITSPLT